MGAGDSGSPHAVPNQTFVTAPSRTSQGKSAVSADGRATRLCGSEQWPRCVPRSVGGSRLRLTGADGRPALLSVMEQPERGLRLVSDSLLIVKRRVRTTQALDTRIRRTPSHQMDQRELTGRPRPALRRSEGAQEPASVGNARHRQAFGRVARTRIDMSPQVTAHW